MRGDSGIAAETCCTITDESEFLYLEYAAMFAYWDSGAAAETGRAMTDGASDFFLRELRDTNHSLSIFSSPTPLLTRVRLRTSRAAICWACCGYVSTYCLDFLAVEVRLMASACAAAMIRNASSGFSMR